MWFALNGLNFCLLLFEFGPPLHRGSELMRRVIRFGVLRNATPVPCEAPTFRLALATPVHRCAHVYRNIPTNLYGWVRIFRIGKNFRDQEILVQILMRSHPILRLLMSSFESLAEPENCMNKSPACMFSARSI